MANTLSSTRPKREIKKRVVIDFNDFIKSGNEDRELARAIRESLKSTAAAPAPPDTKSDSKSDARAGIGDKAGKAKGTTTTTASTRPKRIMNTVKKAMFDYSDLQSTEREERDVARAIQQSLKLAHDGNNDSGSDQFPILKVNRMTSKPQRKFAQNSQSSQVNGSGGPSSSSSNAGASGSTRSSGNSRTQMVKVFPDIIPSTQDFISFLCLRKAPVIDHEIDIPALNHKAALEKRAHHHHLKYKSDPATGRERRKGNAAAAAKIASPDQSTLPPAPDPTDDNPNHEDGGEEKGKAASTSIKEIPSSSSPAKKDQDAAAAGIGKTNTDNVKKVLVKGKLPKSKMRRQEDSLTPSPPASDKATAASGAAVTGRLVKSSPKSDQGAGKSGSSKSGKSIAKQEQQQHAPACTNDKKRKSDNKIPAAATADESRMIEAVKGKKKKTKATSNAISTNASVAAGGGAGAKIALIPSSHAASTALSGGEGGKVTAVKKPAATTLCVNRNGKRRSSDAKADTEEQRASGDAAEERAKRQRKMIEKRKEILKSFGSGVRDHQSDLSSSSDDDSSSDSSSPIISTSPSKSSSSLQVKPKSKKLEPRVTRSMQMPSPSIPGSSSKSPPLPSSPSSSSALPTSKSLTKSPVKRPSTESHLLVASPVVNDRVLRRGQRTSDPVPIAKNGVKRVPTLPKVDQVEGKDFRRVTRTKHLKS